MNVQVVQYNTVVVQAIDDKPNLVLLGDSITAIKNNTTNFQNCSYSDRLKDWWNDLDVINEGIGATCMKDVNVQERITKYHPKYLIILYGINDVAKYKNSNNFYDYYNEKLNEIEDKNPNITIFLSTITWANESEVHTQLGDYYESLQVEFKNEIVQIATERNLTLVNLWDKFYRNESLLFDGIHQNELGALVIATTMNETIGRSLNGSPFSYAYEVQVPKTLNLALRLRLNVEVVEDVNYIPLIAVMFSILIVLSIIVFLFEERRKIIIFPFWRWINNEI